jgi:hypothetical protein
MKVPGWLTRAESNGAVARNCASESNPYREAQVEDLREIEQAWKAADFSRRIATGAGLFLGLSLFANVVQATHLGDPPVYVRTATGIALDQQARRTRSVTQAEIEHQLVLWIGDVRTIPSTDWDLVDVDATNAFVMTAPRSLAYDKLQALFTTYNPKVLGRTFSRTVVRAQAAQIGGSSSYTLAVVEKWTPVSGSSFLSSYVGTLTIAPVPQIPTDVTIGAIDPAGVAVIDYDLDGKWRTSL